MAGSDARLNRGGEGRGREGKRGEETRFCGCLFGFRAFENEYCAYTTVAPPNQQTLSAGDQRSRTEPQTNRPAPRITQLISRQQIPPTGSRSQLKTWYDLGPSSSVPARTAPVSCLFATSTIANENSHGINSSSSTKRILQLEANRRRLIRCGTTLQNGWPPLRCPNNVSIPALSARSATNASLKPNTSPYTPLFSRQDLFARRSSLPSRVRHGSDR